MKQLYALALGLCISFGASAQQMYIDDVFSSVSVQSDVQYGTDITENGDEVQLFMDIYTPDGDSRSNRPALLMAHQGSFIPEYGDKTDAYLVDYANAMAKKGFVVISMNYREGWGFSPVNSAEQNAREILPAAWRAIQDYKTAMRYLRKSVAEFGNPYGISSELIFGGGFGAGGYLPMNAEFIDNPVELGIEELQQKNVFGQPTGQSYIDSTNADLDGIAHLNGDHANYSYKTPLVINISGATPTLKLLDVQAKTPLLISVHSENDQATPFRTDIVRAAGVFAVIEVSGSYDIHAKLKEQGKNTIFENEDRDGYPQIKVAEDTEQDNAYKRGLLAFAGEGYMWSVNGEDTYEPEYQDAYTTHMDSVVTFTAYRIERVLQDLTNSVYDNNPALANDLDIYPNPAKEWVAVESRSGKFNIEKVEVIDLAGKTVLNAELSNNRVNISELNDGIYMLKVFSNEGYYTQRLVKN